MLRWNKQAHAIVVLLICCLTSPAMGSSPVSFAGLEGTIEIAGGTAHIPVMKDAAKHIMTTNPKIQINIAGGGSGIGVQKVGEGLVDIGNTGRALSEAEIRKFGLKSYPFALDGVAVVVHPKNPIVGLTSDQVRGIFAGTVTNWKEVGGEDGSIHLFSRDEASGTREVFWEKLLKKGPVSLSANIVPSNGAMKTAVSQDPAAIGYVSIGHIDSGVKATALDGIPANQENAMNGTYPIIRKLYMNTKGEPSPLVKAFIDYIQGPEGIAISKQHGYLPIPEK